MVAGIAWKPREPEALDVLESEGPMRALAVAVGSAAL
jgi:hypothetical protein